MAGNTRTAHDSMGAKQVPDDAHYGASTQRAVENFAISGQRLPARFIRSLGLIKRAAAKANASLGLLPTELVEALCTAATEVATGRLDDQFVVDVYQTGSGTSTHMNANEVIASRANELLGRPRGAREPVHPNDHVNLGQSSNDVIPSTIHVAAATAIQEDLVPQLKRLSEALESKAHRFDRVLKIGRTHLQDATPVRLGQELMGYAWQVRHSVRRAEQARDALLELSLGGTAVGTGLNTHPDFPRKAISHVAEDTGIPFKEASNHFEAQGARDAVVDASGRLNTIAGSLHKIVNDLRLLGSGPRCGLGEIRLPALQPGSSHMPGKVNPVIVESVAMVCVRVAGNHVTTTLAGQAGQLELNVYLPVLATSLLESVALLAAACRNLRERCIEGLEADEERCRESIEKSLAQATALAPALGYDAAADIAKAAYEQGLTVREVARARAVLPEELLRELLDPMRMTEPGLPEPGGRREG